MLKIAINAQLDPQAIGGITPFLGGLISALGKLEDGDEEYVLVAKRASASWLASIKGENQYIYLADSRSYRTSVRGLAKRFLGPVFRPVRGVLQRAVPPAQNSFPMPVPVSRGLWEGLDCSVVHFPFQFYEITRLPTVYNPHDLQHLHYPEYFEAKDFARRESTYPVACRFSQKVVVASQWVKDDIVQQYGISADKVSVIPWAPPTQNYSELSSGDRSQLASKLGLPDRFILYPAATWPHKNHARLFRALALLREQHGLTIPLVCTGSTSGIDSRVAETLTLRKLVDDLSLKDQIKFLGYLTNEDLRAVYRMSSAVVVPTLFEAASGPVFEAWQEGKPVACSTVTSLPEQVGEAALLFDPLSVQDIAEAIQKIWVDEAFAKQLATRGERRLQDFSWERTARAYRAVYRLVARQELTEEDRTLLDWDWMRFPEGVRE